MPLSNWKSRLAPHDSGSSSLPPAPVVFGHYPLRLRVSERLVGGSGSPDAARPAFDADAPADVDDCAPLDAKELGNVGSLSKRSRVTFEPVGYPSAFPRHVVNVATIFVTIPRRKWYCFLKERDRWVQKGFIS
jgi:hypothetical protein